MLSIPKHQHLLPYLSLFSDAKTMQWDFSLTDYEKLSMLNQAFLIIIFLC